MFECMIKYLPHKNCELKEGIFLKKKIFAGMILVSIMSAGLTVFVICWLFNLDAKSALNVGRLFCAMNFIEAHYVEEVEKNKLIDGAISGMVHALDDPHSIYLPPKFYSQLKLETTGKFGGVGVYVGFKDEKVTVMGVIPGGPGEKAGLMANDEILAVDGTPTQEIPPSEIAVKIRGEIGSSVNLLIHREGEEDKTYTISRDIIKIDTVFGKMLDDRLGYIRISNFSEDTGAEFKKIFGELAEKNMRGFILDLRQNPGGVITSCVEIAREIVPAGTIVSVIQRDGEKEVYNSELKESKYPIVVLLDQNSASASELLAGALQDTKAALIVGTKSYGKGSVQTIMPMFQEDGLKLTIAKYYTPSGRCIDGVGIKPDVEVQLDKPLSFAHEFETEVMEDSQLKAAENLLNKQVDSGKVLFDGELSEEKVY